MLSRTLACVLFAVMMGCRPEAFTPSVVSPGPSEAVSGAPEPAPPTVAIPPLSFGSNPAPTARIDDFTQVAGQVGQFYAVTTGDIVAYAWDCGDGTTSTLDTFPHAYAQAGTYTVRVTVTARDGQTATSSCTCTVTPAVSGGPKQVLRQADFQYLGCFKCPGRAGGMDTAYSVGGIALRRVGGQVRLFCAANENVGGGGIYEIAVPDRSTWSTSPASAPEATMVKDYGGGTLCISPNTRTNLGALLWDEPTQRLYWSYYKYYEVSAPGDSDYEPGVFGYADFATNPPTVYGRWQVDVSHHRVNGGPTRIPDWFAAKYGLGSKTLGLGFGGGYSGVTACSYGPCLYAVDWPSPSLSYDTPMATTELLSYPYQSDDAVRDSYFCPRPGSFWSEMYWDDGAVKLADGSIDFSKSLSRHQHGGPFFFVSADYIWGAGIWIDTPNKSGMLFGPRLAQGRCWYGEGGTHFDGGHHPWWMVYDPTDLGAVLDGTKQSWEAKPAHQWKNQEVSSEGMHGFAFDPVDSILYVFDASAIPTEASGYFPAVHAYRVLDP
jgi:PKD repeat protein